MKIKNTRREFVKTLGNSVLGGAALSSGLLPLMANAATSSNSTYKALVCINLNGGNDAYNTVVPTGSTSYDRYSVIRQGLALPKNDLQLLKPLVAASDTFGLHPACKDMADLFNNGKLAVVANLGNLIEPVDKASYLNGSARLPDHLFSHFDQTIEAQTLNQGRVESGWAGRVAEAMRGFNINQQLAMSITLSGNNYWQRGSSSLPYSIRSSGINLIDALDEADGSALSSSRAKLYRHFLNKDRGNMLQKFYSDVQLNAWSMAQYVSDLLKAQPPINLPLMSASSANGLSQSLAMVARMIAAQDAFQVKRQIFYINIGSFDTHRNQLKNQEALLAEVNSSLASFYSAMAALGYGQQVTAFTLSEFGRTFSLNGTDGTDHGWASHQFVVGDAVRGQRYYGDMQSLDLNNDSDIGEGRMIPTLSYEQYAATLCRWFGVQDDDLAKIFPNLGAFTLKDVGFMV